MKTLKQILEENTKFSLSDQWLIRNLVSQWLQQKQDYRKKTGYEKSVDSQKRYRKNQLIKELLEELVV